MSDQPVRHINPIGIEREQALFLYLGHKLLYDRKGRYKMPLFRRYIGYFIPQKEQDLALTWLLKRGMLYGYDPTNGQLYVNLAHGEAQEPYEVISVQERLDPTVEGLHILDNACSVFEAARDWDFGHWRTRLARWIFNRLAKARREA